MTMISSILAQSNKIPNFLKSTRTLISKIFKIHEIIEIKP